LIALSASKLELATSIKNILRAINVIDALLLAIKARKKIRGKTIKLRPIRRLLKLQIPTLMPMFIVDP